MEILELAKKAKGGDQQAFGEIYDLYAQKIYKFICYKVKTRESEDILQEVFIKAWNGMANLKLENLNFNAWLYRIASNTINDYFRKFYRTEQTVELDENASIYNSADVPANRLALQGDVEMVKRALKALPSQYQQVLELRFIQDFTLQETANILNKSNLAVRLLQHRALKNLRANLDKKYDYGYEKI